MSYLQFGKKVYAKWLKFLLSYIQTMKDFSCSYMHEKSGIRNGATTIYRDH